MAFCQRKIDKNPIIFGKKNENPATPAKSSIASLGADGVFACSGDVCYLRLSASSSALLTVAISSSVIVKGGTNMTMYPSIPTRIPRDRSVALT